MVDTLKYANNLKEIATLSKEFADGIKRATYDSFGWGLEHMADSYVSIFERFCPFEIGDKVELIKDVPCESGGWYPCRHFLIRGATATVHSRGYSDGHFTFDVIFDDESWIDDKGEVRPIDNKHTFGIGEKYFRSEMKQNDDE